MKKNILAFLLICGLLGCLTGCGEQSGEPSKNPSQGTQQSTDIKYAYQPTYLPIDTADTSLNYVSGYSIHGNMCYFFGDVLTGTAPSVDEITGEPIMNESTGEPFLFEQYETQLFSMNLESGTVTQLEGYQPTALPEGCYGNSSINQLHICEDGTLWLLESTYAYYYDLPEGFDPNTDDPYAYYTQLDNLNHLIHLDSDGNVLQSIQLATPENGYFSYGTLILDSGELCTTDFTNLQFYGADGRVKATVPVEGNLQSMYDLGNGRYACTLWDDTEGCTYLVDLDIINQTLGQKQKIPTTAYSLFCGIYDFDFTYEYNGALLGYDAATGESEQVMSWLDCDVDSNNIHSGITVTDDAKIYAIESTYEKDGTTSFNLIMMKPVDPATLPVKEELTLACFSLDWDLRSDIVKFNKNSDDVRIIVTDYSQYATDEDWAAGLQKLNTEIMSGVLPDILLINDNMPVDQYIAKDVLMDLWPLIDQDEELSREDLMTHFFDALSVDGKLYQLVDSFSIFTVSGKTSVVGENPSWTMADFMAVLEQQPDDISIFSPYNTKEGILSNCIARNLDSFINWETLECSFDSQEFIDLLTFANQFPAEYNFDYETDEFYSDAWLLRAGKQLLFRTDLCSFSDFLIAKYVYGEDATFVGYPTANATGNSFVFYNSLSLTSNCSNVDAAWRFIRTYLTEEHQTQDYMYRFPTNRHSFDQMTQKAMTPTNTTDGQVGVTAEEPVATIWYGNDDYTDIYSMSQEDLDDFMAVYNATNTSWSYNEELYKLISEHTAAFFDGQKTAEETAKLIQSSVSLYVFENA